MRVWLLALYTIILQMFFTAIGFTVGLIVASLVMGYTRAWQVVQPPTMEGRYTEDE